MHVVGCWTGHISLFADGLPNVCRMHGGIFGAYWQRDMSRDHAQLVT
ncbi:MAG: hypothetical protein IJO11_04200 [Alphaproteobacteria bacterium]|nr:hypothetical protein [Alphaproteobacteria bacterium]